MGPLKKIKVFLLLGGVANKIQRIFKESNMKLSTNLMVQVLATLIHGATQLGQLFPDQATLISLGVGLLQSVVAIIAHYSNTNGTPQEVPGGQAGK